MCMPDSFFRELDVAETLDFQQWARDNHNPGDKVEDIWHPVIRAECKLIDEEAE